MLQLAASGGASCVREDSASYRSSSRRLPSFTESALLSARFESDDPRKQGEALQAALRRLGAAQACIELSLGEGLGLLRKGAFDFADLGHSHFDSLCHGRYGFSGAHGRELRSLSAQLKDLPLLREAFAAGLIPRTRIRSIASVATPDSEAAWARLAMQLTSRELQRRVASAKAGTRSDKQGASALDEEDDPLDELESVSWLGSRADKALWQFLLVAIRQVLGKNASISECAEMLAAETLSGLPPVEAEGACATTASTRRTARLPDRVKASPGKTKKALRQVLRALRRAGAPRAIRSGEPSPLELPSFEQCRSAVDVHDELLSLVTRLHSIENERAKLLAWMQGRCLYRQLGFRSFHHWLERSLGMSPQAARLLLDLQARAEFLPALDEAWAAGSLSTHQVRRVAQVADRETVEEWIRFAGTVTPKHLDAAVVHAMVHADLVGAQRASGLPPWDRNHGALLLDWQRQLGVRGACGSESEPSELEEALRSQAGGMSRRRIGFRATGGVAKLFREAIAATRQAFGAPIADAEAIRLMAQQFLAVHVNAEVLAHARRHAVMERDGWTCVVPHCRSQGPLHAHHVRFRSRGGGDETWNLASVCEACHALIHAGKILMHGQAPGRLHVLMGTRREAYLGERRLHDRDLASFS